MGMSAAMGFTDYPKLRVWTRSEYHRAGAQGIFRPTERLELVQGQVIQKVSPQGVRHAVTVMALDRLFRKLAEPERTVICQVPLIVDETNEPEPDLALLDGQPMDFDKTGFLIEKARLIIEVGDSTVGFDRRIKLALYAEHGVSEYWIVNIPGKVVEVYRDPAGAEYRTTQVYGPGQTIEVAVLGGKAIRTDDVLIAIGEEPPEVL